MARRIRCDPSTVLYDTGELIPQHAGERGVEARKKLTGNPKYRTNVLICQDRDPVNVWIGVYVT